MATYTVTNGTTAALSNINAGGDDVPALGSLDSVLTNTELGTLLAADGISAVKSTTTKTQKRRIGKLLNNGGRRPGERGEAVVVNESTGNPSGVLHYTP